MPRSTQKYIWEIHTSEENHTYWNKQGRWDRGRTEMALHTQSGAYPAPDDMQWRSQAAALTGREAEATFPPEQPAPTAAKPGERGADAAQQCKSYWVVATIASKKAKPQKRKLAPLHPWPLVPGKSSRDASDSTNAAGSFWLQGGSTGNSQTWNPIAWIHHHGGAALTLRWLEHKGDQYHFGG